MLDLSTIGALDRLEYLGNSLAFGGEYTVYPVEDTYIDKDAVPQEDRGKLLIIELMNDDTPMYFFLETLNPSQWKKVEPTDTEQEVLE